MGAMTPTEEREALAWEVERARRLVEKGEYESALDELAHTRERAVSPMPWSASLVPWSAALAVAVEALAVGIVVGVVGKPDPWGVVHVASAVGLVGGLVGILGVRQSRQARSWLGLVMSITAVLGIVFALIGFSLPPDLDMHFV